MKILLVNPPSRSLYTRAEVKGAVPYNAPLTTAVLAAPLLKDGHEVAVFDFNLPGNSDAKFMKALDAKPDYVGITFNTPLFPEAKRLAKMAHDKGIKVLGGGPHASAIPVDTLKETDLDIVIVGEGDFTLPEIMKHDLKDVKGICYKDQGKIKCNPPRPYMKDLDVIPFPAWQLYDLSRYQSPSLVCKKNPLGFFESSRGCVFECSYCNKCIFGRTFRSKSPRRAVDELKHMLKLGFKEIYFVDDGFSTQLERSKEICRLIIKEKLKFPWQLTNGIRVDRVDKELFTLLKKAGCYRVAFGIESGNEEVMRDFGKHTKLEQVRQAVDWATKAGIETWGFFMLALPADTEETMQDTIDFAKSLNLTLAKYSITTPYPGTKLFNDLDKKGLIKSKDWGKYNVYEPHEIYDHPQLSWPIINRYYKKAYREFYFRPGFFLKRAVHGLRHGTLLADMKSFLGTRW
ncbi:MAG: B12-binding domain-containing radical SAM protein [Nanoarchaeota archaeon]|nr:B12-binding domain-containing radical SAM protein [Nanoarchaeota archaeon]